MQQAQGVLPTFSSLPNVRSTDLLANAQALKTWVADLPTMGDEAIIVSRHWT